MARRGMSGQLNMFDLFQSLDEATPGEVEMVSLMPEFETEPEVVEEPETEAEPEVVQHEVADKKVAMSRCYEIDGKKVEIAYINYNKVCISREGEIPVLKEFASTIEAVDYYVEQIKELETDE